MSLPGEAKKCDKRGMNTRKDLFISWCLCVWGKYAYEQTERKRRRISRGNSNMKEQSRRTREIIILDKELAVEKE